jgi:hypothetical protein
VCIGHFGVGFAAKAAAPRVSLGSMFLAAQFIDLLWPTFLLLGWKEVRIAPGITAVTPIHAANLLGPPPPSEAALAWVGQAQWLLVFWGYWIDRHRRTVG